MGSACLLCCLPLRVLCGLVRLSYAVVFALPFQVLKWVFGCVVLEAVRVVHVIICKCVVHRGVQYSYKGKLESDRIPKTMLYRPRATC